MPSPTRLQRFPVRDNAEQCSPYAVQLERVAVNVSRSAMPSSSDNSELANRLAMQAAALEADNMDPLGLGRIDTQVLGLVSAFFWSICTMWACSRGCWCWHPFRGLVFTALKQAC